MRLNVSQSNAGQANEAILGKNAKFPFLSPSHESRAQVSYVQIALRTNSDFLTFSPYNFFLLHSPYNLSILLYLFIYLLF